MIGLALFIKRSVWGLQIQAVAQNRLGASLAGIDSTRTTSLIFVISGALAALSGALLAPLVNPSPDIGAFPLGAEIPGFGRQARVKSPVTGKGLP